MTDHDIAHLRELESAATGAPWRTRVWCFGEDIVSDSAGLIVPIIDDRNAALIAAMRNELPWLLEQADENARLRERLARVEALQQRYETLESEQRQAAAEAKSIGRQGLHERAALRCSIVAGQIRAALAETDAPEDADS
jgi:hypothetical protein